MENFKDWGIAIAVLVIVIRHLFELYKQSRKEARDERKEARDDVAFYREQIQKISDSCAETAKCVSEIKEELAAFREWREALEREVLEMKQKASQNAFELRLIRDGLNEARHELGMEPVGQTPSNGIPVYRGDGTDGQVVAVTKSGKREK